MKGIENCAECAYYSMKTHKCSRGAKVEPELSSGDDVRFFADCPLCEAEPVRHGKWVEGCCELRCSVCKWDYSDELPFMSHHGLDAIEEAFAYCPHCGARMGGGESDG